MLLLHKARCIVRGAVKAAMCNGNADMGGDLIRKLTCWSYIITFGRR
jgi:hypothetical protein